MKTFRDSSGTEWTVFEVRREPKTAGGTDWSYLPHGFNRGWLCFESSSAKRRLVHFPERWRELSDSELDQLRATAQPAPRSTLRLGDLGDTFPQPDAHRD